MPTSGVVVGRRVDEIGKAVGGPRVLPKLARVNPNRSHRRIVTGEVQNERRIVGKADEVSKAGLGALFRTSSAGYKQGRTFESTGKLVKPKASIGDTAAFKKSPAMQNALKAGQYVGYHRKPIAVGGAAVGAGGTAYGLSKAYGDPEDARYARLGAATALQGAGGLAAIGYGGARIARDTRETRRAYRSLPNIKVGNPPGKVPQQKRGGDGKMRALTDAEKKAAQADYDQRLAEFHQRGSADRAVSQLRGKTNRAAVVRGRPAAAIAGGLALLGGAEATRRRATERRWN